MASMDVGERVFPDFEARLEEAVSAFRENHRHPANLALHAVGYVVIAKGAIRILRGKVVSGAVHVGAGVGMLVAGHRIEGNEPFTAVRTFRSGGSS